MQKNYFLLLVYKRENSFCCDDSPATVLLAPACDMGWQRVLEPSQNYLMRTDTCPYLSSNKFTF